MPDARVRDNTCVRCLVSRVDKERLATSSRATGIPITKLIQYGIDRIHSVEPMGIVIGKREVPLQVRVSSSLKAKIIDLARERDTSLTSVVVDAINAVVLDSGIAAVAAARSSLIIR